MRLNEKLDILCNWLGDHVRKVDAELAAYQKERDAMYVRKYKQLDRRDTHWTPERLARMKEIRKIYYDEPDRTTKLSSKERPRFELLLKKLDERLEWEEKKETLVEDETELFLDAVGEIAEETD